jgi:Domain of unknown function (DUF4440)
MRHLRLLWFALLCVAATARADPRPSTEQTLIAADTARVAAMVTGDWAALELALADDLTYGHSGGQVQGKREFIDDLRNGVRRYRAAKSTGTAARNYGCAGVVTGTSNLEVEYQGQPLSLALHYTATYAQDHGRWVLVAYQSVKLP